MVISIKDRKYNVIKDYGDTISDIPLDEYVTDYYDNFDYIVGDWAYGKVRLKGFYRHGHKFEKKHNDYNNVDDYINNQCAYGCKYFILEKIEKDK